MYPLSYYKNYEGLGETLVEGSRVWGSRMLDIITNTIPWGSLLYLYYKGARNPILIIKAPRLWLARAVAEVKIL